MSSVLKPRRPWALLLGGLQGLPFHPAPTLGGHFHSKLSKHHPGPACPHCCHWECQASTQTQRQLIASSFHTSLWAKAVPAKTEFGEISVGRHSPRTKWFSFQTAPWVPWVLSSSRWVELSAEPQSVAAHVPTPGLRTSFATFSGVHLPSDHGHHCRAPKALTTQCPGTLSEQERQREGIKLPGVVSVGGRSEDPP